MITPGPRGPTSQREESDNRERRPVWQRYYGDSAAQVKGGGAAARREAALSRAVLDSTADGFLAVGEDGKILRANARFLEMWRVPVGLVNTGDRSAMLAHASEQLVEPKEFLAKIEELDKSDEESVDWLRFRDGRLFERFSRPLLLDGKRVGRLWSFRDVTEQERAEEALRRSEALLRAICEGSPDPIFVKDTESRMVLANPATLRVIGKPAEAVLGRPHHEVFSGSGSEEMLLATDRRVMQTGQAEVFEQEMRTPEGTRVFLCTKTPRRDPEGQVTGIIGVARDITTRKRVEDALRQSEANLAAAQRIARLGSWEQLVTSVEPLALEPLIWSEELCRIYGFDPLKTEVSNDRFFSSLPLGELARIEVITKQALREGRPYQLEHRITRADGAERIVQHHVEQVFDGAGELFKLVGTVQDVTEQRQAEDMRRRLEEKLRQAQKMEAIGQLAGGVAHDFNNLLTVILGSTELLAQSPGATTESREFARQITAAGRRAANLTRQLLAFSRQQVMQVQALDLNEVLANVYKMLSRLLGEHISLQCNYGADMPRVEGDLGMVEQVIMNLAINARDAMPKGGRLRLTTQYEELGRTEVSQRAEGREGRFVTLTVSDTGCGMDAVTLNRVFEPFFTTKDVGKGTGLGLATVYGVVKQHNGWIEVVSEVGCGSTFKVFLPEAERATTKGEGAVMLGKASAGGHETILLVEDELAVRLLARACLRQLGYRVVEASNGPEALVRWHEEQGAVDLVLTDLVMPEGMSGQDLVRQLRQSKPGVKAVYSSGYTGEVNGLGAGLAPGECFLPKPYEFTSLARLVRQCLDGK